MVMREVKGTLLANQITQARIARSGNQGIALFNENFALLGEFSPP